jgi:hypothetical protein
MWFTVCGTYLYPPSFGYIAFNKNCFAVKITQSDMISCEPVVHLITEV